MSTRTTEVSIGDTHLVRVADFDDDWPFSITVKYETTAPASRPVEFLPVDGATAPAEPSRPG